MENEELESKMEDDIKIYKEILLKEINRLIEGSDYNIEYWEGYRYALIDLKDNLNLRDD